MKLEEEIIEIKKQCVYEQDVRSKVLTMNVTSSNSEKVSKMLTEIKINGMRHVSFAHATSEERRVATYCNEMKNVKTRCKTLFDVRFFNQQLESSAIGTPGV